MIPSRRPHAVGAALLAALLLTAGCDSGARGTGAKEHGTAGTVVAPGKPGEPAKRLSPEQAAKAVPDNRPNSADLAYAEMMIVHHRQALRMTRLAGEHAHSDAVERIARRIAASQQPEIEAMQGWLESNGASGSTGGHMHMDMPGMATEAQLERLEDARGEAFDDLFLKLMITHHQGAVTMATDVLSRGRNVRIAEMATDLIAQQTREMSRMRAL
ncbi:DUF305 domain-containing protein [Streptomyces sulfonofaciens]|uniref:DUF305 domain-containing protein n=1 Tax=Streptomyces sulfonofaciens TaxID=68272 RepID=UPI0035714060